MESYSTARQGEFVYHLHYDYLVEDKNNADLDRWEITPGLAFGITDRLMVDVHTHFAKFGIDHVVDERRDEVPDGGPSPFIEAVAATLQYRVTEGAPVDLAVMGVLEVPMDRAKRLLGSDDPVVGGWLILARELVGHSNLTLNLGHEREGDEDDWLWAIGAKTPLSADPHGAAAGIEFLGTFEAVDDNWMAVPGIYLPLGAPNVTLKNGIGIGREDGAGAFRANVTLMVRF